MNCGIQYIWNILCSPTTTWSKWGGESNTHGNIGKMSQSDARTTRGFSKVNCVANFKLQFAPAYHLKFGILYCIVAKFRSEPFSQRLSISPLATKKWRVVWYKLWRIWARAWDSLSSFSTWTLAGSTGLVAWSPGRHGSLEAPLWLRDFQAPRGCRMLISIGSHISHIVPMG